MPLIFSRTQRPVMASEKLPTAACQHIESGEVSGGRDSLVGSNMRRIAPETQAVFRGRMNSKPSPETRVT